MRERRRRVLDWGEASAATPPPPPDPVGVGMDLARGPDMTVLAQFPEQVAPQTARDAQSSRVVATQGRTTHVPYTAPLANAQRNEGGAVMRRGRNAGSHSYSEQAAVRARLEPARPALEFADSLCRQHDAGVWWTDRQYRAGQSVADEYERRQTRIPRGRNR